MRRKVIKTKSKQIVTIPDNLLEFFYDVHELIEAEDKSALMESDDLIQCEKAYGGLLEEGGIRYGFTYFPEKGTRQKWELELDVVDIANISEGSKSDLVLWGCLESNCRCLFSDPNDTCFYCDYIDEEC